MRVLVEQGPDNEKPHGWSWTLLDDGGDWLGIGVVGWASKHEAAVAALRIFGDRHELVDARGRALFAREATSCA